MNLELQPFVETLGWTLLHFLWQGAAIAALLFLAQAILQRSSASTRYWAACVALLLMASAPVLTFSYLAKPREIPIIRPVPVSIMSQETSVAWTAATPPLQPSQTVSVPPPKPSMLVRVQNSLPWLVAAWLSAVTVLSLRLLLGWLYLGRVKKSGIEPLGEAWEEKLATLVRQLQISRPIRLFKSILVEVPTVIGWLRPVILLPASSLTNLTPSQLEAILAHELTHIRRHDYLVNLLQSAVETLLFYHPAVWWVSRHICQERENCCDDLTVKICGDRIAYAKALATLEELRSAPLQFTVAAGGGSLLQRIRRLMGLPAAANRSGWWVTGAIALLLLAAFVVSTQKPLLAADSGKSSPKITNTIARLPQLHFRLVAEEGDLSPADEFTLRADRKLRVLKPVLMDGSEIESAEVSKSLFDGRLEVAIKLSEAGGEQFARLTGENVGRMIAIIFAEKILSAPRINERIPGRNLSISGDFTKAEAEAIALALNQAKAAKAASAPSEPGHNADDETRRLATNATVNSIQDARLLVEMGILDEAEAKLQELAKEAPERKAALYYLEYVRKVRPLLERMLKENPDRPPLPQGDTNLHLKGAGFEIFDKPAFGMSDFMQRAQYLRALQGELERTISKFEGVESAKVQIISPENRLVPVKETMATVFIGSRGMQQIEARTVNAIRNFVANAVEGLKANNVNVVDNAGNSLAEAAQEDSATITSSTSQQKATATSVERIDLLIQDARLLIEMGRLDEAELKLQQAVKQNPLHTTAHYYLNYIKEVRFAQKSRRKLEVDLDKLKLPLQRVNLLKASPFAHTNLVHTSPQRQRIYDKLDRIVIPKISFDGIPLSEAIKTLSEEVRKRDPDRRGLNFIINSQIDIPVPPEAVDPVTGQPVKAPPLAEPVDLNNVIIRIMPEMRDKRLAEVLDAMAMVADKPLKYSVEDYAIVFSQGVAKPVQLVAQTFDVGKSFFENLQKHVPNGPKIEMVREFLAQIGLDFPTNHPGRDLSGGLGSLHKLSGAPPAAATKTLVLDERFGTIGVRATRDEIDIIERIFRVLNNPSPPVIPERSDGEPRPGASFPNASPLVRTNLVHTSPHRQRISDKLDRIVFDEIRFDGIPLSDVIKNLSQEVKKRDPDRRGLNFIINSQIDIPVPAEAVDPITGQPRKAPTLAEPVDLNKVIIRINPPLTNIRLRDVLDAITKVAEKPLRFSVEDYAVVFTQRSAEPLQLFTRTIKVEPNTFFENLRKNMPKTAFAPGSQVEMLREFATQLGLEFPTNNVGSAGPFPASGGIRSPVQPITPTQKALLFNDRSGILHMRATLDELDTMEQAIKVLNSILPQPAPIGEIAEPSQLLNRTLKVDPNFISENLEFAGPFQGIAALQKQIRDRWHNGKPPVRRNLGTNVAEKLRNFLVEAGITFPMANVGGETNSGRAKAMFVTLRTGIIYARAPKEELDAIESIVQVLNSTPPQVNLSIKFVEITRSDAKAMGFDWFLGTAVITNTPAPKTNAQVTPGVLPGIPPETPSDDGKEKAQPPVATITRVLTDPQIQDAVRALEQKVSNLGKATNSANQVQPTNRPATTLTGILTDPQFRALLRALEQRGGVDVLSMPSVTTLSGRQAKVEVSESKTVVFGVTTNREPVTKNIPLGPSVDIIPYVSADGHSIQLTIAAGIVEFLGYDDPGPFVPNTATVEGNGKEGFRVSPPLIAQMPVPRFRVRQITSKATVWDGQTLVLSGFVSLGSSEDIVKLKSKIPVLGDIPLLGRFFRRTETNSLRNKQLILFVTPTIIDPAGNRVHTEGNRRFDPNTVPAQPPQN